MAGISSTDKSLAAELVSRIDVISERASKLAIPTRDEQVGRINELASAIRTQKTYELLRALGVDVLEPCGWDARSLERTGCTNLASLYAACSTGKSNVMVVPDAARLRATVNQVQRSTYDLVPILFDTNLKPVQQRDLLAEIRLLSDMPEIRHARDVLLREVEELAPLRGILADIPGFFGNLFMGSRQREQITSALSKASRRVPLLEERLAALEYTMTEVTRHAHEHAWDEYALNPSRFEQTVIDLAHAPARKELPVACADVVRRIAQLKSEVDELVAEVKRIDVPSATALRARMKEQSEAVRRERMLATLRKLDVSLLQEAGISAYWLRRQGYENLADLEVAHRAGKLGPANGGGESKEARAIRTVSDATLRLMPLVIDEKRWPKSHEALVNSVLMLWHLPSHAEALQKLTSATARLGQDYDRFFDERSLAERLYLPMEMRSSYESMLSDTEARLGELRKDAHALKEALAPSSANLRESYKTHQKAIWSTLRQVTGASDHAEMPIITSDIALKANGLAKRYGKAYKDYADTEIPTFAKTRKKLLEIVRDVNKKEAELRLDSIDIDVLAHGNVRVGPLKSAGFETVGSLWGKAARQLARNPRVTYDIARSVEQAVNDIYQSAVETARCRFDAETKPAYQQPLVIGLYEHLSCKALRKQSSEVSALFMDAEKNAKDLDEKYDYLAHLVMTPSQTKLLSTPMGYLEKELPTIERQVKSLQDGARRLRFITAQDAWNDFEHNAASYYAALEEIGAVGLEETTGGLPKKLVDQVARYNLDTSNLTVTLRRYQRFGAQYALHQGKTLIGDEMGLGKTVEAIATMAHLYAKGERYFMVVCPLSVLINWSREIPKHSKLRAYTIHGTKRAEDFHLWCLHGGVAVTTYETVAKLDWVWLKGNRIAMLVADEAHYVKNPDAKRTKALVELALAHSNKVLFLTGTPLENKVEEMNTLIGHLNPSLVRKELNETTCINPIKYRQAIAPVYLRRKREDVLSELPRKVEEEDWCELSRDDLSDYRDSLVQGNFSSMRRVGWRHADPRKSAKGQRLLEICEEAKSNGSKVLIFSFFLDTIAKVQRLLGDECIGAISGRIPAARRQELIDEFGKSDKTVLVSQVTAGGVGLNIQVANIIIFCEPQLKPSIEDQAISRSYRMGQVRTVVVHRLLMNGTVDERITEILERKRAEFNAFADESQMGMESLGVVDTTAILEIIEEQRQRYNIRGGKAASTGSNSNDGMGRS